MMQADLLELNAAEVVDIRGVPFHFLQFKFHLGLCNHLLLVRAHSPRFLPESPGAAAPARPDTEPKVIDRERLGGITLTTPTSVGMPLNSQRTSSQSTQFCKSGRMASSLLR
jgi:hypothetical protein